MAPTLSLVEQVIRASWSAASCDPVDAPWSPDNPSKGQCNVTALVVQDHLGGDLLMAEVLNADGTRQGVHFWNRLTDGTEVDLTREQFRAGEQVQEPEVFPRPADITGGRVYQQYVALADGPPGGADAMGPERVVDPRRPDVAWLALAPGEVAGLVDANVERRTRPRRGRSSRLRRGGRTVRSRRGRRSSTPRRPRRRRQARRSAAVR